MVYQVFPRLQGKVWFNLFTINNKLEDLTANFNKLESDLAISCNIKSFLTEVPII